MTNAMLGASHGNYDEREKCENLEKEGSWSGRITGYILLLAFQEFFHLIKSYEIYYKKQY